MVGCLPDRLPPIAVLSINRGIDVDERERVLPRDPAPVALIGEGILDINQSRSFEISQECIQVRISFRVSSRSEELKHPPVVEVGIDADPLLFILAGAEALNIMLDRPQAHAH